MWILLGLVLQCSLFMSECVSVNVFVCMGMAENCGWPVSYIDTLWVIHVANLVANCYVPLSTVSVIIHHSFLVSLMICPCLLFILGISYNLPWWCAFSVSLMICHGLKFVLGISYDLPWSVIPSWHFLWSAIDCHSFLASLMICHSFLASFMIWHSLSCLLGVYWSDLLQKVLLAVFIVHQ